jgi:hypothetical protein
MFWLASSTVSLGVDEAVLLPDVTPSTTAEFEASRKLDQALLVKLESAGFIVLNRDVLSEGMADEMMLCAESVPCPQQTLGKVPARLALVIRLTRAAGGYQASVALHERGEITPVATWDKLLKDEQVDEAAKAIAEHAAEQADGLSPPDPALRSMASQMVNAAGGGPQVWVQADVGPCEGEYSTEDILEHLARSEEFLKYSDPEGSFRVARQMEEGLACYQTLLSGPTARQLYARVFRAIGGGLFMGGQQQQATLWFVGAVQLDPQFEYGLEDMAENHPVWRTFRTIRALPESEPALLEGAVLGPGEHYLNGSMLQEPKAREGQRHIYQHVLDGEVETYPIEGSRFPKEVLEFVELVEATKVAKTGQSGKNGSAIETSKYRAVSMVEKEPRSFKTSLMAQLRVGAGFGAVDRFADLLVDGNEGASDWIQEGPRWAGGARFEGYFGVMPVPVFEFGLLVGGQMARHVIVGSSADETVGSYWVATERKVQQLHIYVQPRLYLVVGEGLLQPVVFAGFETLYFGTSQIADKEILEFPGAPGGFMFGGVGGLGTRIRATDALRVSIESSWTGHFGLRSSPTQVGTTPVNKPSPGNVLRQTIGFSAGVQIAF